MNGYATFRRWLIGTAALGLFVLFCSAPFFQPPTRNNGPKAAPQPVSRNAELAPALQQLLAAKASAAPLRLNARGPEPTAGLRPSLLRGAVPPPDPKRDVLTEIPDEYRTEEVDFEVRFGDVVSPYRVLATFVMPGEVVPIEVPAHGRTDRFALEAFGGTALPSGRASWSWTAPGEPGLYPLHVDDLESGETMTLNVFVMVPYDIDQGVLNGYRIGRYEPRALRDNPAYNPPTGLVEVTAEIEQTLVSPHFMLAQFLCKQEGAYPKYLLLREPLLLKLERILHAINARGIETPSLHVMSGYRTPHYNRSIGNKTSYSRHLYGDAADVYVDTDDDNYMDDLTGDEKVTRADAEFMAHVVEQQRDEPWYISLSGGLGIYSPAPHRGPFIHVDVRGEPARW